MTPKATEEIVTMTVIMIAMIDMIDVIATMIAMIDMIGRENAFFFFVLFIVV